MLTRFVLLLPLFLLLGCEPEDQTPGLWLSGTSVETFPDDWSFSKDFREIAIEVSTPYFIAHSVTIWCVEVDGDLFLAAGQADTKNWPGWVDDDSDVVLKIGEKIYQSTLVPMENSPELDVVRAAFAAKYNYEDSGYQPSTRWWSVQARNAG